MHINMSHLRPSVYYRVRHVDYKYSNMHSIIYFELTNHV